MDFGEELKRVADVYRRQGYNVTLRPGPDQLPPFAGDFKVEIVGRRGSEGVLVAVKKNRDEVAADSNMQRYAEITGSQPGWRFDLAILEAENPKARDFRGAREFTDEDIRHTLVEAGEINRMGFSRFAVVAAWAALEAAMRLRLRASGQEAGWGSVPRQMLKELYSAGLLSPDEFHRIEQAFQLRNQVAHGFTFPSSEPGNPDATVVEFLSDIARRLVSESHPTKRIA
jgi:uncharacterized protein YutE (UPF0331/DUF86 family)